MKSLVYQTALLAMLPVFMYPSEKAHEQQMKEQVLFELGKIEDDSLTERILSFLTTPDLFNIRATEKRMKGLVEIEFANRIETLSYKDLFKVRHIATLQLLKESIESEMVMRGKKQNQLFKELLKLSGTLLDLSKRNIDYLYPGAFAGMTNVPYLSLSCNQLSKLEPGIFNGLVNLQGLYLIKNQLKQLEPGVFNGLVNLRGLYLVDNQLKQLKPGTCNGLANLKDLDLRGNQLKQLEPEIFNGLVNLRVLYLGDDQLTTENINLLQTALRKVSIT